MGLKERGLIVPFTRKHGEEVESSAPDNHRRPNKKEKRDENHSGHAQNQRGHRYRTTVDMTRTREDTGIEPQWT